MVFPDTYKGSMMEKLVILSTQALENECTPLEYRNRMARLVEDMPESVLLDLAELIVYR